MFVFYRLMDFFKLPNIRASSVLKNPVPVGLPILWITMLTLGVFILEDAQSFYLYHPRLNCLSSSQDLPVSQMTRSSVKTRPENSEIIRTASRSPTGECVSVRLVNKLHKCRLDVLLHWKYLKCYFYVLNQGGLTRGR